MSKMTKYLCCMCAVLCSKLKRDHRRADVDWTSLICVYEERKFMILSWFKIQTYYPCPANDCYSIGQGCPSVWLWNTLPLMWWYDHWGSPLGIFWFRWVAAMCWTPKSPLHRRWLRLPLSEPESAALTTVWKVVGSVVWVPNCRAFWDGPWTVLPHDPWRSCLLESVDPSSLTVARAARRHRWPVVATREGKVPGWIKDVPVFQMV